MRIQESIQHQNDLSRLNKGAGIDIMPQLPAIAFSLSRRSLGEDGVSFYPLVSDVSF